MPWPSVIISLIPEIVRGVISIIRDKIAAEKAEQERLKAEAERDREDRKKSSTHPAA